LPTPVNDFPAVARAAGGIFLNRRQRRKRR
jgi:hypothetical protein